MSEPSWTMNKNYYALLGVQENATSVEIKTAFLKKCKETHPDMGHESSSHEKFVAVNKAYEMLSCPAKRRQYDLQNTSRGWSVGADKPGRHYGARNKGVKYHQRASTATGKYRAEGMQAKQEKGTTEELLSKRYFEKKRFSASQAAQPSSTAPSRVGRILTGNAFLTSGLLFATLVVSFSVYKGIQNRRRWIGSSKRRHFGGLIYFIDTYFLFIYNFPTDLYQVGLVILSNKKKMAGQFNKTWSGKYDTREKANNNFYIY